MTVLLPRDSLPGLLRRTLAAEENADPEFGAPIDPSRWFVCPTLTPLYYAPIYRELNEDQARRYNQLTGLCFSELIALFEEHFAASVLATVARAKQCTRDPLADCLEGFLREERRHLGYWRQLNLLSEPGWYAHRERFLVRLSPVARQLLSSLTARPFQFPAVFWIMLSLEERSLEISRRCLRIDRELIEPQYREAHRRHLQDEIRHVQLDCHLIERFFAALSPRWRRVNARLMAAMIGRFFLPPTRSAVRVVRRLALERPELAPRLGSMVRQLRRVGADPAYREMALSRSSAPLTFAMLERFPETQRLSSAWPFHIGPACTGAPP